MSDEVKQPCGEFHPLPCGLDEACRFIELIEKWRAHGQPADEACADELAEILEWYNDE